MVIQIITDRIKITFRGIMCGQNFVVFTQLKSFASKVETLWWAG